MTLTERIDEQILALLSERTRIERSAAANLAEVDTKLAALQDARSLLDARLEAAYTTLLRLKLVKEI